jgi:hypothetical protein
MVTVVILSVVDYKKELNNCVINDMPLRITELLCAVLEDCSVLLYFEQCRCV